MTDYQKSVFAKLGILDQSDEEGELPFEELVVEKTKEETYAYVQEFARLLVDMGAGPYTVYKFKERCNALARKGACFAPYYALCCEYAERMMKQGFGPFRLDYDGPKTRHNPWW